MKHYNSLKLNTCHSVTLSSLSILNKLLIAPKGWGCNEAHWCYFSSQQNPDQLFFCINSTRLPQAAFWMFLNCCSCRGWLLILQKNSAEEWKALVRCLLLFSRTLLQHQKPLQKVLESWKKSWKILLLKNLWFFIFKTWRYLGIENADKTGYLICSSF